jgi:dolichol-phosphate mannosyltransferase
MKISIVLPTYNESGNIVDLLSTIDAIVQEEKLTAEILVVDDDSSDGTAQVVEKYRGQSSMPITCLVRKDERGLATAIKTGILQAAGDVIMVMDTDFNHDPIMIPQMVKFLEYYDLVIGSRFVKGGGMEDSQRYYYSLLYNIFVRLVLRMQIQDNLSGFFAIRREKLIAFNTDQIFLGYGEYFIRLLYSAHKKKYHILEVPVYYNLRRHGKSKSRFLTMVWQYSKCVFSTYLHR